MNPADIVSLPVRLASTGDRGPVRAEQWPDVLAPRVLFRGTFLQAESASAGRNARAFVTAVLADWRIVPLIDDAVLCVSELVGNAVQHAVKPVVGAVEDRRISIGVRCWGAFALFLEVGDYDPQMPRLPDPTDDLALCGRGLTIVGALSDQFWWERAAHGGKVVYARFHLPRYGLSRNMVGP